MTKKREREEIKKAREEVKLLGFSGKTWSNLADSIVDEIAEDAAEVSEAKIGSLVEDVFSKTIADEFEPWIKKRVLRVNVDEATVKKIVKAGKLAQRCVKAWRDIAATCETDAKEKFNARVFAKDVVEFDTRLVASAYRRSLEDYEQRAWDAFTTRVKEAYEDAEIIFP